MGFGLLALAFLGTWWFWIVFVEIIALFILVSRDEGGWAAGTLGLLVIVLWFTPDAGVVWEWLAAHRTGLAWAGVVYFPVGLCWALFKWFVKIQDVKVEYLEQLPKWRGWYASKKANHQAAIADKQMQPHGDRRSLAELIDENETFTWDKYLDENIKSHFGSLPPKALDHKADFIRWLSYWPFSALAFVCGDLVRRIAQTIYNALAERLQRMSNRVFRDIELPGKVAKTGGGPKFGNNKNVNNNGGNSNG